MPPVLIADCLARFGWRKLSIVTLEPQAHIKQINLFAPQHAGERLALNHLFFFIRALRVNGLVELVCFATPCLENFLDIFER